MVSGVQVTRIKIKGVWRKGKRNKRKRKKKKINIDTLQERPHGENIKEKRSKKTNGHKEISYDSLRL